MTEFLTDDDFKLVAPAETNAFRSPIPTQDISNGEYLPSPQSEDQRRVEARIKELADILGRKQGLSRRRFLRTSAGMAAAFVAMNDVYGPFFGVSEAEAATPELAGEIAMSLAGQFIFDGHTHFLRPDASPQSPLRRFVNLRKGTAKAGLNPELSKVEQTYDHLMFENYIKEMFFDSDTKIALVSGAPSDIPDHWFLTNEMKAQARKRVNDLAGSLRMMAHAIFTPGQPGWLDDLDEALGELKPDSMKGYTVGDNTHKDTSKYPWRMDDEDVTYKGYEKMVKAGIRNVCVHKGLFPPSLEKKLGRLTPYASVADVGKAAKDWPQLNFLIYHSGYRHLAGPGGSANAGLAQFEKTGRIEWVTDLAEIPEKFGVGNVYADLGATFAQSCVSHPKLAGAILGTLIKGLGPDHVVWGTDSLWYGSPRWQIEALRRLEIPVSMRKKYGYAPLGAADGLVKSAIFGFNSARLYGLDLKAVQHATATDNFARYKAAYQRAGAEPSNAAYGYVARPA